MSIRAIIDTNVVFQGLTKKSGACGFVIDAWRAGVIYLLTHQTSGGYMMRVAPEDGAHGQKTSFDNLLKKWGDVPASDVDRILDAREPEEPEPDLTSELLNSLKTRIAHDR